MFIKEDFAGWALRHRGGVVLRSVCINEASSGGKSQRPFWFQVWEDYYRMWGQFKYFFLHVRCHGSPHRSKTRPVPFGGTYLQCL